MERDRKCILCETVHASRQEMDEHMRSMLHHRELEKLKGRDCGHECRVCKVTMVSLTEYASHISSTMHKQNVEEAEQRNVGPARAEDYFDQVLVDLIEKRKEAIRKEKEAAAAKLAREEEERRRKEGFQQRLKEVKEQFRLESSVWQKQKQSPAASWYRGHRFGGREEEEEAASQPWHGKSATWHAQEPPNFHRWGSAEFSGKGSNVQRQDGWRGHPWEQEGAPFNSHLRPRLPWISNGDSSNGVYGRNNAPSHQLSQRGTRPLSRGGLRPHMFQSAPSFFGQRTHQFNQGEYVEEGGQGQDHAHSQDQGHNFQSRERAAAENEHSINKNPKLHSGQDHRWSPYPIAKGAESLSHRDPHHNPLEKHPRIPSVSSIRKDTTSDTQALKAPPPQAEEKQAQCVDERGMQAASLRGRPRGLSSNNSSCNSSSHQKEEIPARSSTHRSLLQRDLKTSAFSPRDITTSSTSSAPPLKQSGSGPPAPSSGHPQSKQERQLPEILKKARQMVEERRRASLDNPKKQEPEMLLLPSSRNRGSRQKTAAAITAGAHPARSEEPASKPADSGLSLQSLQVSTSVTESSEAVVPGREEETLMEAPGGTGTNSGSDTCRTSEAVQQQQQGQASGLSRLDLPPVLKRDLTKHITHKSKAGGHEPNLNIARRVRNVGESRRSDSEKESGLRPTVRQLISSSGSRRNVNWEQVYQEMKKKQDKGKGMPRFGIEMVPVDQEDQSQEEDDDIPLLEGFQWDLLLDSAVSATPRKRSLSESSVAPSPAHSALPLMTSLNAPPRGPSPSDKKQQGSSICRIKDERLETELVEMQGEATKEKHTGKVAAGAELHRSDSLVDDSEQPDGQGTGKRRRAVRDVPSAETSCSEHNSKRQKVKSKNERQQIDQLLAVSLREEELSGTLQSVEASLIQARATLEAAYLEVQRLSVVKQQMTADMNALRNKRIEILKGMQGSRVEVPQLSPLVKTETAAEAVAAPPAGSPQFPAATCPSPAERQASPPSSSPPLDSITIKQEPQSPVRIKSEPDLGNATSICAHSTTPELQATASTAPASPPPGPALHSQELLELQQADPRRHDCGDSADWKEKLPEALETSEKCVQASQDFLISVKLSPSRRDYQVGGATGCKAAAAAFEPMAPPPPVLLGVAPSPSELRGGKRVRKLKKRKLLKKALGAEPPESSDTELDGEALKPRWLRPRRRPSGGSQVSTSSGTPSEERCGGEEEKAPKQEQAERRSPRHSVKHPLVASAAQLATNLESDDSMEVCQQPPTDPMISESLRLQQQQQQSLGCNEVTSTSDMDICKSSESDVQGSISLSMIPPRTSSEVSSDHGDDDLPTEGVFEGHQEAVNAVQIHDGLLYTCSGDRTVRAFDLVSHKCVSVFEGHSSKVSCLLVSAAPGLHHRLYSGSSDQTIRCYSLKTRELEQQFSLPDRVLCLLSRWKTLFAGLANGTVVTFNLKTNRQMDVFECHAPRAVSCLASSQEGARRLLLTGSFDSTISVRDAKSGLLLRTLQGHTKTVLCMNVVNDLVFSGSSDQCICAHNIHTGELVRVNKGHSHAVTVVTVLGKVMVTACLDKLVRVYDLQSHEQLQVYGGHKDMVMCMAVHRSMIYTGCYDGSVQAIKLNLLQNFRCWWQGCTLVFGLLEHLQHHLVADHGGTSAQMPIRCRWRSCEEVFCARAASKQAMLMHLQKHGEEANHLEP